MNELKQAVDAIIKKDFKIAFEILLPIAKDGNASARFYLGYLYFNGLGVFENEKEAKKLQSSAAKIFKEQAESYFPLKRAQEPRDVAYSIAFLASDEASEITGQALNVNGGGILN